MQSQHVVECACDAHVRVVLTRVVVDRVLVVVKQIDCVRNLASVVRRFETLACVVAFVVLAQLAKQSQEEQRTRRVEHMQTAPGGLELRNCALVPA